MFSHINHLLLPLSRNELFRLLLNSFGSVVRRTESIVNADEVLEIATHLRAERPYRLLPFGLTDLIKTALSSQPSYRGGSSLSLLGCSGLGISSHIGAGRSPPQVG
jgi:hypothetical protein